MSEHRVPGQLRYLIPRLADGCASNGKVLEGLVLKHGRPGIEAFEESDELAGDSTEYTITFSVPQNVYDHIDLDNLEALEHSLRDELDRVVRVPGEYVRHVLVAVDSERGSDGPVPTPVREQNADLWGGTDYLRLFISHRAEDKALASRMKENCLDYGISCFVAHEDIEPTAEWQSEITRALLSMDALVALLTADFHSSSWTDQEIGAAVGRAVPVIPVSIGCDPYGFIGYIQAIRGSGRSPADLSQNLLNALLYRVEGTRGRMREALVARFEQAASFAHAKELMRLLTKLDALPPDLVGRLAEAPAKNSQVREAHYVPEQLAELVRRLRGQKPPTR
ncbi:MAG: toll/interleukin-1 receptor domain-containing protein [Armatimonadia bacterium]